MLDLTLRTLFLTKNNIFVFVFFATWRNKALSLCRLYLLFCLSTFLVRLVSRYGVCNCASCAWYREIRIRRIILRSLIGISVLVRYILNSLFTYFILIFSCNILLQDTQKSLSCLLLLLLMFINQLNCLLVLKKKLQSITCRYLLNFFRF